MDESDSETVSARRGKPVAKRRRKDARSGLSEESYGGRVLFQCAYGRLPKLMLFVGLPFLTAASVGLFIATIWFGVEFEIRRLPIPPALMAYGIAPGMMLLVIGCVFVEVNQRKYPRRIVVQENGILVPKGRIKTGEMLLSWKGMTAKITAAGFMSDVRLKNKAGQSTRLNLMMFPTQEDFDGFVEAVDGRAKLA